MKSSTIPTLLRVGTWNLAGRWSTDHAAFLKAADCDVWLLTEVSESIQVRGSALHLSEESMSDGRRWAGILSTRPTAAEPDPHPASALALVNGVAFCSSILPWRSCGANHPWVGKGHGQKTAGAISDLLPALDKHDQLVWGGDWNHSMTGREYAGSIAGRASIQAAVDQLRLRVLTRELPHRLEGALSIDHLSVGPDFAVRTVEHLDTGRANLSDHDAYVAELELRTP